jgi:uncharacterized Zn-finger protein
MLNENRFLAGGREVVLTPESYVQCQGDVGPLGHPTEYMTLERGGTVTCEYCGCRFLHEGHAEAGAIREHGEKLALV